LRLSSRIIYSCTPTKYGPGIESKKGIGASVGVGVRASVGVGSEVGVDDGKGAPQPVKKMCKERNRLKLSVSYYLFLPFIKLGRHQ
jgi:hypothetical protein